MPPKVHTYQYHKVPTNVPGTSSTPTMVVGSSWIPNITQWHPYSRTIVWLATITIISSMYYIHAYNKEYVILAITRNSLVTTFNDNLELNNNTFDYTKYVVYNNKCRIPNLEPFNSDVKKYMRHMVYKPCTKYDPLTYLTRSGEQRTVLTIDDNMRKSYAPSGNLSCCYSIVFRNTTLNKNKPDNGYSVASCVTFKKQVILNETTEFLIVKCSEVKFRKVTEVYSNSHSIVPMKKNVRERLDKFKKNDTERPISVLMIGIDSISRLNLYRTMPKTVNYLKQNGWYELLGYNKMEDNTFPNLMAIFTGFNITDAYSICNPRKVGKLDECPLIFYIYRDLGYATAFGEDEASISTFNYLKVGFKEQPTDHYIRPLVLASQKSLKLKKISGTNYCIGSETSEELILNYANNFISTYKNDPYFGFFWMNGFSHNDINEPSMLDLKTKQWFENLETTGIYNDSIVIFLSDHGMRFGSIRETNSGWLEERLPFIWFWLPEWFRQKFPDAVKNLQTNAHRFTTPYDLHMTLQDVLLKSGRINRTIPSRACPTCKSLFSEIEWNRDCDDTNIQMHWCTCYSFKKVSTALPESKDSAHALVTEIQTILAANNETQKLCRKPVLKRIIDARKSEFTFNNTVYYLLVVEVYPKGKYEGTILEIDDGTTSEKQYKLKGHISRIDKYNSQSHCVSDAYYKKYCYCIH